MLYSKTYSSRAQQNGQCWCVTLSAKMQIRSIFSEQTDHCKKRLAGSTLDKLKNVVQSIVAEQKETPCERQASE